MSLKHAILGFLSYTPFSGYDLKKAFDRSVQHFWPADQSQIYRTLAQLEEQGLVTKEVIDREDRLDLKIYHLTPAGLQELQDWLSTPLPAEATREPFLVQVFFAGKIADEEIAAVIEAEIHQVEERVAEYEDMYQKWLQKFPQLENQREFFFTLLTLEYGLRSNKTYLTWLEGALQRIRQKNYVPKEV
ncbi:MAG TPA: PadR family transcriptional regulator [Anaerolineales bacterium]